MSEKKRPNPYAVPLEELESSVHVPVEDQTTEVSTAVIAPEHDEEKRALRLAGGV